MSEGVLSATIREAVRIWDGMKADGVSFTDRVAALEKTIRQVWPFQREWKFLCDACDDRGLRILTCAGDHACGREKPHLPHEYGVPCWCAKGARWVPKPTSDADFTAATKVAKPTRFGR